MFGMHPDDVRDEEARFFGPRNELQAAYEVSMATTPQVRPDAREVDRLLRCGFWLVLGQAQRFCRYTDAILPGHDEYIEKICATRAEAEAEAYRIEEETHGDIRTVVL
jgi:hypothetical protein